MYLKYVGKEETTVWKVDGKKSSVKPGEVFEASERIGKQYLSGYKHLFEESEAPTPEKSEPKKETPKKATKKS